MTDTRPHRLGTKVLQAHVTLDEWRTMRDVATKTTRTQADLIREAIVYLAQKYGVRPLPKVSSNGRNKARALRHE